MKRIILISISILLVLNLLILITPSPSLINLLSRFICPGAIYSIDTDKQIIALTIDDSPDPNSTIDILDVLDKYQVKATFFAISSQVEKHPEIVTKIVSQGHELGNHLTKDEPSIQLGNTFESELLKAEKILARFAPLNWFRPGGGWCNAEMVDIARKHNYQVALGSVWSYDTHIPSSRFSTWFILHNVRPGSIIVLHDAGKNGARGKRSVKTLERVLPELQQRGFQIVPLSDLMNNKATYKLKTLTEKARE